MWIFIGFFYIQDPSECLAAFTNVFLTALYAVKMVLGLKEEIDFS